MKEPLCNHSLQLKEIVEAVQVISVNESFYKIAQTSQQTPLMESVFSVNCYPPNLLEERLRRRYHCEFCVVFQNSFISVI